jgi:predicted nicotinamide N-methyase
LRTRRKIKAEGVPGYLTKIIGSPLAWIEDEGLKEKVWEQAATRLSERSGRSGMGDITRTFEIPLRPANPGSGYEKGDSGVSNGPTLGRGEIQDEDEEEFLQITLHEPALTADNLGLKTWASSYMLAKRLPTFRRDLQGIAMPLSDEDANPRILELGSGTGLVGLAAAAIGKTSVVLTDLPPIVPNLERNAVLNAPRILAQGGGNVQVGVLDWTCPSELTISSASTPSPSTEFTRHSFPLVLVADPIYSPEHPALLVSAISYHLQRSEGARVVVAIPIREGFASERDDFRRRMEGAGFRVMHEGEDVGWDDWGAAGPPGCGGEDGVEGLAEVRCWWSVWGWGPKGMKGAGDR